MQMTKTATFIVDPGMKIYLQVDGEIQILLNQEKTGIFISTEDHPILTNSAYVRSDDCPVRFFHTGKLTLWASSKDPYGVPIGVSLIETKGTR